MEGGVRGVPQEVRQRILAEDRGCVGHKWLIFLYNIVWTLNKPS